MGTCMRAPTMHGHGNQGCKEILSGWRNHSKYSTQDWQIVHRARILWASKPLQRGRNSAGRWQCSAEEDDRQSSSGADDDRPAEGEGASSVPDAIPLSGSDTDWREFRARLVASSSGQSDAGKWVHHIPQAERGCILISHPLMFTSQQEYFHQAVIFIFEHTSGNEAGERANIGSVGVLLNRPTQYNLGELAGGEPLCPEFASNRLFLGGDVGEDAVFSLHNLPSLRNSEQIVRGVCMGGWESAKEMVAADKLAPESVKFFSKYCGWGPGQLDRECKSGVWFMAAASASFLLQQGPGDPDGEALWHEALSLMGGDYAALSKAMEGGRDDNIMDLVRGEDPPDDEQDQ